MQAQTQTPIIFVHGNGDDATKWMPIIWLFESNGYPADRLYAIRFTDPVARAADGKPEEFRSSTTDQASELSALVTRVLLETKARKVALIGSSRGGMTIRNYLKNAGGAAVVSHAILCGTPNHGVMAIDTNLDNEFNGKGTFLRQLNEGSELVEGVKFMTTRSDKLDKYAQPNVGYDGPELKGAENVVLPNLDHRELAFQPVAFASMFRFLTGQAPARTKPIPEAAPLVSGVVTSQAGSAATNRPLGDVHLRIYRLKTDSADREPVAVLETNTNQKGTWGPLQVQPSATYEFVLEKEGKTVTYFMSGLLRSTALLNLRLLSASGQSAAGANLIIHRPQGYLARDRDPVTVDGQALQELAPGIPSTDSLVIALPAAKKAGVRVVLRDEVIYARPAQTPGALNLVELIWD